MRIAYIIKTYRDPELLSRIVSRLNCNECDFYIHIDQKVNLVPFKDELKKLQLKNIYWVKRENIYWGEFGSVQASLNAFNQILKTNKEYDHICQLSGQDYPIKSNQSIHEYLQNHQGINFLRYAPMPVPQEYWDWGYDGGINRITQYHYRFLGKPRIFPQPYSSGSFKNVWLNKFLSIRFKLPRHFPEGLKPYGGEAWICLSSEAIKYVIELLDVRPEIKFFFRYCWCPGEMFFQTILCNSENFQGKIINDHLHCIMWDPTQSQHPLTLTLDNRDGLLQSEKLFARKFDPRVDIQILNWIDKNILNE